MEALIITQRSGPPLILAGLTAVFAFLLHRYWRKLAPVVKQSGKILLSYRYCRHRS